MNSNQNEGVYQVWGADNTAYGPIELPELVRWVKQERVTPTTWIYMNGKGIWAKASELPELRMFLRPAARTSPVGPPEIKAEAAGIRAGALRRIKILAGLDDSDLATLLEHIEVQEVKAFSQIVRAGEHGNSMYLILYGELRARIMVDGKESTLATLEVGDFFGEISLLDEGPRSADVLANTDSLILRLSSESFKKLMREQPALALQFTYALGRVAAGKIRSLTKRYQDSVHFSHFTPSHA
jgi:hypothetical protein